MYFPCDEYDSGLLKSILCVCFYTSATVSLLLKTTATPSSLFPLVPNLPVGLYRLEIDHMRKARYLQ